MDVEPDIDGDPQYEDKASGMKPFPGSTRCHCEWHYSALLITFYEGRRKSTLLLQTDYDQAAFAVACGVIKADRDWDGTPSKLGKAWEDCNLTDIDYCPDYYRDVAETEYPED